MELKWSTAVPVHGQRRESTLQDVLCNAFSYKMVYKENAGNAMIAGNARNERAGRELPLSARHSSTSTTKHQTPITSHFSLLISHP